MASTAPGLGRRTAQIPRRLGRRALAASHGLLARPVVAGALAGGLVRLPRINDPVTIDVSVYLTIATAWLRGLVPYRDVFDHKGPLVYELFALFELVSPTSPHAVRLLLFALFVVSLASLAALVRRHAGERAAWLAVLVYAVAASGDVYDGADPNLEQLSLPLGIAAIDLADRYAASRRARFAAGAGAAVAGLALFKPQLAFSAPLVGLLLFLPRPGRARALVAAAGAGVLTAGAIMLPYALAGALGAAQHSLLDYNRLYAGAGRVDLFGRAPDEQIDWAISAAGEPFIALAAALGAFSLLVREHRRLVLISGAWAALMLIGAKAGVRDFSHYFVPIVPPLAVLVAAGVASLERRLVVPEPRARSAVTVAVLAPVFLLLALVPARERLTYGTSFALDAQKQVARIVQEVTTPSERVYVATPFEGQTAYWLGERLPASRYIFPAIMPAFPYLFDPPWDEVVRDLERTRPAAIVVMPEAYLDYLQPIIERERLKEVATVRLEFAEEPIRIFARRAPLAAAR